MGCPNEFRVSEMNKTSKQGKQFRMLAMGLYQAFKKLGLLNDLSAVQAAHHQDHSISVERLVGRNGAMMWEYVAVGQAIRGVRGRDLYFHFVLTVKFRVQCLIDLIPQKA